MKIDDTAYEAGKRDFKRGTTLRQLFEMTTPDAEKEKAPDYDYRAEERKAMSRCLGFGEAFLEFIRSRR